MDRNPIATWARAVAWLSLSTAPVFAGLGMTYAKPEWICAGAALTVYGLIALRKNRAAMVDRPPPADAA